MQLRRISLRNIRSYERADLDLTSGTTLVCGDVGSGKTSLLYAVEMALFGFAEVDAAYLVRHQATEAEVRLTLGDEEHTYELLRRFSRRTRRGKEVFELEENAFTVDGAKATYSTTELRQRAIDLLGFPDNPSPRAHSDLWRWAVYIPQERMREILDLKPEDRLTTVRKALGLEQYQLAAENAQDVASELRRTAENREAEAVGLAHWEEELARGREALELRGAELAATRPVEIRTREKSAEVEGELVRVEAGLRGFESDERDWLRLGEERARAASHGLERRRLADQRRTEVSRLRANLAGSESAEAVLESAKAEEVAAIETREKWRRRREELEAVRRVLENAVAESRRADDSELSSAEVLRQAKGESERALTELTALEHEDPRNEPPSPTQRTLPQLDELLHECQERIERLQGEVSRWEIEVREVEELLGAGVCPRCHQPVQPTEFATHLSEFQRELESSRAHRTASLAERERLRAERIARERFEREHDRWEQLEGRRALGRSALGRATDRAEASRLRHAEALGVQATARAKLAESLPAKEFGEVERELKDAEGLVTRGSRKVQEAVRHAERSRSDAAKAEILESEALRLDGEAVQAEAQVQDLDGKRGEIERRRPLSAELEARRSTLRADRDRLRPELEEAGRTIVRLESQLDEANRQVARSTGGVEERRRASALAQRHRSLATWISQPFREAVLKLEHRLLARAQHDFDRAFGRFFSTLIEDPSLVARSDVAFSPIVEIEGEWTPPEALSGGERTALALAYRLALGQVVRSAGRLKLDTLILDEPTDGFSPEQVTRMGELLEEIGIPQVLLVSHEGGLASVADQVVRVQKEDGLSTVTREGGGPSGREEKPAAAKLPKAAPLMGERRRRVRTPRLDAGPPGPVTPGTP